jgi:type II secretory ATPase GspE/PulE/Tfp pilus assembly ATPase PilB-like protein
MLDKMLPKFFGKEPAPRKDGGASAAASEAAAKAAAKEQRRPVQAGGNRPVASKPTEDFGAKPKDESQSHRPVSESRRPVSESRRPVAQLRPIADIVAAAPDTAVDSVRPASRAGRVEATEENIAEFLGWSGPVLTSSAGGLEASDQQRLVCAYFGDGIDKDGKPHPLSGSFLVTKLDPLNPQVMQVRYALKRAGKHIRGEYLVELDVIRKVHEAADRRTGSGRSRNSGTEMQTEFLKLIGEAAAARCSDIHLTVERYEALIRVRSDGVMQRLRQIKASFASDLCAAAFNMADASDASYRPYEYQGARVSDVNTNLPEGVQSVRLQFNPLPNGGRYMICRLLYAASGAQVGGDIDTLGYNRVHIDQIKRMRKRPFGINIISGPTGSGKSTTLQRALSALMREKRGQVNVITIEDPPEYVIEGAAQLPVTNAATDAERNEKFRQAISASLRSDPDIIMIGEIRDKASSALAFAAAMTGHQVWASLHANDAVSILDRFRDQQVEDYKLSDHTLVTGLIGQRLIRKLCPHCRLPFHKANAAGMFDGDLAEQVIRCAGDKLDNVFAANPEGCENCRNGYAGRMVIAEVILPDINFMRYIRKLEKEEALNYWIEHLDGLSMLEHAVQKMVKGYCDPRDVEDKAGELIDFKDERKSVVFGKLWE